MDEIILKDSLLLADRIAWAYTTVRRLSMPLHNVKFTAQHVT